MDVLKLEICLKFYKPIVSLDAMCACDILVKYKNDIPSKVQRGYGGAMEPSQRSRFAYTLRISSKNDTVSARLPSRRAVSNPS